jgi:hypothetical protein
VDEIVGQARHPLDHPLLGLLHRPSAPLTTIDDRASPSTTRSES